MSIFKRIWSSIQGDPAVMRRFHGWSTVFFIGLVPVAAIFRLVESTAFVSYLSLVALILGSLSAWQASRVEVVQVEQEKRKDETDKRRDEELVEKIDKITPDN